MTAIGRPQPAPPRPYRFPRFERRVLGNGMRVLVAPMPALPIVTVTIAFDAGAMTEPSGQDGVASLTARALLEGTTRLGSTELSEHLERLGASVVTDADWDAGVVSVTMLRSRLEPALALLAEIVRTPAFPEGDVERLKIERLAEIMQARAEPRGLADDVFARATYAAGSRYARPHRGTATTVSALTRAELAAFHAARFRPGGATIILAGDVTAADAERLAASSFGDLAAGAPAPVPLDDRAARATRALHLAPRAEAPQSEIRVGHVGLPRAHPEYFSVLVMNAILGGLFSSRINLNLREKHAYTYFAFSGFDWRRGAGPFSAATAVQSDVTAPAAREILAEIDAMRATTPKADEVELATSYLAGVFPIKYETTDAVASALAAMAVYGLPEDYFDVYRDRVRGVTAEHVRAAAEKHLHPDALQLAVVGDAAAIRAPLEALAFGPLITYDRDGEPVASR